MSSKFRPSDWVRAELESAFINHTRVPQAAVIGKPHESKVNQLKLFIIFKTGSCPKRRVERSNLKKPSVRDIGPIAHLMKLNLLTGAKPERQDHETGLESPGNGSADWRYFNFG